MEKKIESKINPFNLSKKYKCDKKTVYKWLEDNNIKKKGDICGVDYFIDEGTEQEFFEWLKTKKAKNYYNHYSITKRYNISYRFLRNWLKINNQEFCKDNEEKNKYTEKLLAESLKTREKLLKLNNSPMNISRKYKCDHKKVYNWLKDNNIKKDGFLYRVHYFIDEEIERQFYDWLKNENESKKESKNEGRNTSARGVAKRSGFSRETVCQWARKNGVTKIKNIYVFTDVQEEMFLKRNENTVSTKPTTPP
jgi:transposase